MPRAALGPAARLLKHGRRRERGALTPLVASSGPISATPLGAWTCWPSSASWWTCWRSSTACARAVYPCRPGRRGVG